MIIIPAWSLDSIPANQKSVSVNVFIFKCLYLGNAISFKFAIDSVRCLYNKHGILQVLGFIDQHRAN